MQQAQGNLQEFTDTANEQGNANAEAMNNLMGVMNDAIQKMQDSWAQ